MSILNNDKTTLRELKKISKILTLSNASIIEKELSKIATTNDRKKMWVLIDGKRMVKDIAKEIDITERTVLYFITAAATAELIEYTQREPPRRILDYVPPSWIDLVKLPEIEEEKTEAKVVESVQKTLNEHDKSQETTAKNGG